jgi:hypothetical protein
MAKRKYKRKNTKKNNSFTIFLVIIIILAILSFLISYFVIETESEAVGIDTKTVEVKKDEINLSKQPLPIVHLLEGTWASYNDGAMLTIKGNKFTIELPSVESSVVATGDILIKDSTITFVYSNKNSACSNSPGVYKFIFETDEEFTLKKVVDDCESRSNQLIATWFKV